MHRRKMLKSTGASTHPCLTPVHTGKEADSCPPIVTLAFIPSWNCRRMHPNQSRMSHSRFLCTVSKALERSTKAINRSWYCSLHFSWSCRAVKTMSTVLLFFLKPHCDSGNNDSVMLLSSLCSNTLARTLPATARSDIPLWLPQMVLSPLLLYMVTILVGDVFISPYFSDVLM